MNSLSYQLSEGPLSLFLAHKSCCVNDTQVKIKIQTKDFLKSRHRQALFEIISSACYHCTLAAVLSRQTQPNEPPGSPQAQDRRCQVITVAAAALTCEGQRQDKDDDGGEQDDQGGHAVRRRHTRID